MSRDEQVAIVGAYEHPARLIPDLSPMQLQAIAAAEALADAGLSGGDVDAIYSALDGGLTSRLALAEYLGVTPATVDTTMVGGASFEFHVAHARSAIRAGKCQVALITYGATNRSAAVRLGTGAAPQYGNDNAAENMEAPWGATLVANYALVAMRHMHEFGTTAEQLAEISVATRAHAVRNPAAMAAMEALRFKERGELSVADVVASPMIADPLHKLECCMVSDGAGAVVLDVSRGRPARPGSGRCGCSVPARRSGTCGTAPTSVRPPRHAPGLLPSVKRASARRRWTSR